MGAQERGAGSGCRPRGLVPGQERKGDMHTGPAPLLRREREERRKRRMQQHLSSSGWFRRLDRCTGTPPALGISGTTAGKRGGHGPSPRTGSPQPHGTNPCMLQQPPHPPRARGSPSSFFQLNKMLSKGSEPPRAPSWGCWSCPRPDTHMQRRQGGQGDGHGVGGWSVLELEGERSPQRHPPLPRSTSPPRLFAQRLTIK